MPPGPAMPGSAGHSVSREPPRFPPLPAWSRERAGALIRGPAERALRRSTDPPLRCDTAPYETAACSCRSAPPSRACWCSPRSPGAGGRSAAGGPDRGRRRASSTTCSPPIVIVCALVAAAVVWAVPRHAGRPRAAAARPPKPARDRALPRGRGARRVGDLDERLREAAPGCRAARPQTGATQAPGRTLPTKPGTRSAHLRWDEVAIVLGLLAGVGAIGGREPGPARPPARPWRRAEPGGGVARARRVARRPARGAGSAPGDRRRLRADGAGARRQQGSRAGRRRRRSSTSSARAAASWRRAAPAASRLTDLFEWAKFSQHEPEPEMRDEAIDALVAVRGRAAGSRPEPAAVRHEGAKATSSARSPASTARSCSSRSPSARSRRSGCSRSTCSCSPRSRSRRSTRLARPAARAAERPRASRRAAARGRSGRCGRPSWSGRSAS